MMMCNVQIEKLPPSHITVRHGHVVLNKKKKPEEILSQIPNQPDSPGRCAICRSFVNQCDRVSCLNSECSLHCHLICLSQRFVESNQYVPIIGSCPSCKQMMLWGDIVRKFKGIADAIALVDDE